MYRVQGAPRASAPEDCSHPDHWLKPSLNQWCWRQQYFFRSMLAPLHSHSLHPAESTGAPPSKHKRAFCSEQWARFTNGEHSTYDTGLKVYSHRGSTAQLVCSERQTRCPRFLSSNGILHCCLVHTRNSTEVR